VSITITGVGGNVTTSDVVEGEYEEYSESSE